MKTRKFILCGVVCVLVVGAVLMLYQATNSPSPLAVVSPTGALDLLNMQKPSTRSLSNPEDARKLYRLPDLVEFDEYLSRFGRDDDSLVAVYCLTQSQELISELSKQAHTPLAFLLLALKSTEPAERLAWANQWAKSPPANNAAKLLVASLLAETGSISDAQIALLNIQSNGLFYTPESEVKLHMVEGLEVSGWNSTEARMATPNTVFSYGMVKAFKGLASKLWEHEKGSTDDDLIRAATNQIRIGDAVETWGARNEFSNFGYSIKMKALSQLPPDTLFGDTGFTVLETIQKLDTKNAEFAAEINRLRPMWDRVTNEQRARYFDHLQVSSVADSIAWLEREVNSSSPVLK